MKSHYKIASGFDVKPLREKLETTPDLFDRHPLRKYGESPHKGMVDIWVRYNDITPFLASGDFSKVNDKHTSVWYPSFYEMPEIVPLIFNTMALVNGEELGAVLITKLPPGGEIEKHVDLGWHALYYDKYYIPIKNHTGAIFGFEDGIIRPDEGDVWWFNNQIPHWVENNSNEDRIALIVCIRSEKSKERNNAS
jgi:Aspartyl/Asparaginyl beta-hydroxylase